ncbi:MAG: hypothetical protein AAFY09_07590 [Pseudomonadota bacterium]
MELFELLQFEGQARAMAAVITMMLAKFVMFEMAVVVLVLKGMMFFEFFNLKAASFCGRCACHCDSSGQRYGKHQTYKTRTNDSVYKFT